MIPNDPMILLSYLNTALRDRYDSLAALCEDLELDEDALRSIRNGALSVCGEKGEIVSRSLVKARRSMVKYKKGNSIKQRQKKDNYQQKT